MLLSRPDPKERWRVTVFIAVVVLHLLAGLLILATSRVRIAGPEPSITPLTFFPARPPTPPEISNSLDREASRPKKGASSKAIDQEVQAGPNNAISSPDIDWDAEARASLRRKADDEETQRRRRNLAGPSESQLEWWRDNAPLVRDQKSGDVEQAEGGELITWVDDKCYFTTHGITTLGLPQTSQVCKDPPKPETALFKDMRQKLDQAYKSRAP
jgi:hypothetical protein